MLDLSNEERLWLHKAAGVTPPTETEVMYGEFFTPQVRRLASILQRIVRELEQREEYEREQSEYNA